MTGTAKGTPRARHETRGKTGRPAKLDREMIAHAAYEIGLDRVTMKAVADQLGVSVPGLYHHVEGRDDLMQLAAQYSASRIHLPEDRNQTWPEWLLEWSRVSYLAFLSQPELLIQSMRGSFTVDRMVIHVDAVVGFLIAHGFSPVEARDAYTIVSRCAIGAAISEIRQAETGRGLLADYHRVLSSRTPEELPNLRKVVAEMHDDGPTLEQQICTVLIGIAARRGEPWKPILDLRRARPHQRGVRRRPPVAPPGDRTRRESGAVATGHGPPGPHPPAAERLASLAADVPATSAPGIDGSLRSSRRSSWRSRAFDPREWPPGWLPQQRGRRCTSRSAPMVVLPVVVALAAQGPPRPRAHGDAHCDGRASQSSIGQSSGTLRGTFRRARTGLVRVDAVVEVNDAVLEPAFIEEFELHVDVVLQHALAASHDDRAQTDGTRRPAPRRLPAPARARPPIAMSAVEDSFSCRTASGSSSRSIRCPRAGCRRSVREYTIFSAARQIQERYVREPLPARRARCSRSPSQRRRHDLVHIGRP